MASAFNVSIDEKNTNVGALDRGTSFDVSDPSQYYSSIIGHTYNPFNYGKNAQSAINTLQSQAFNSAEAAKNRDWQEAMSNSAHQREVEDLKAAGLNTWLGVDQGGASTPSGSSATSSAMQATDFMGPSLIHALTSMAGSVMSLFGHKGAGAAVKTAGKVLSRSASSAKEASNISNVSSNVEDIVKKLEPKHRLEEELKWTRDGTKKANALRDLISDFGSSFTVSD